MTTALKIIDIWRDQEDRMLAIYEDAIAACGYKNPPALELADLDQVPATKGMAACYSLTHEIFVDFSWASQAPDDQIAGCLAHELAHAAAGIEYSHGPRHQEKEDEIIDRMRCHGISVTPAPIQGGAIRADDWRGWLKLLSWVVPAALAFPATLIALAWSHHS
jgi:hypothetical protein